MIKSVGIDFAGTGEHKVRCLDEQAQLCDGFGFQTSPEGLAKLEEHVFRDESNPIIVFEPTGLSWLVVAVYLRARHPDCRLVRTQGQKVVALRKYLRRSSKSDKIDSLTLAKMPFIDQERLKDVYLPQAKIYAIQRLSRQRKRLESDIAARKTRNRELRLMEAEEAESEAIAQRLKDLYGELHSSDNLRTIPGVGEHTAPVFLAFVGDLARFRSQSAFANFTGVVPDSRQSADMEAKGLRMTKAGPAMMKWALYQAGQIGRRFDPQLAWLYYREIVHNGKNHRQAMGAVMSHIGARVLAILRENRPYELRDVQGRLITRKEARRLILLNYQVTEEIKRERRQRKTAGDSTKAQRKRRETESKMRGQ